MAQEFADVANTEILSLRQLFGRRVALSSLFTYEGKTM